ncbi:helix-turn-helix domain-containing protein [Brevibacillus nitrificans]|uniref:ArsR/SmtB family transcription factor n=1 Tax=Brevibacillus nitrificans TaxID=651560 RepID=UPI002862B1B7|nr:helix-turn-helix domain-containing protein [Brevibacillus nitrificans]MDR7319109.1 DNA-binding transcriptional ArsR family regulator [Brevibacillus nitrificans]
MRLMDITNGRKTYEVELQYSMLFESALGLAAATYPEIHHTLEKPPTYWSDLKTNLSSNLAAEVSYLQRNNTWKTILNLLDRHSFKELSDLLSYIKNTDELELRYESLPFLGYTLQETRRKAAEGASNAANQLQQACYDHKFFPDYIHFICEVNIDQLKNHLITVMDGWYQTIVAPHEETIRGILERDFQAKLTMMSKMEPEALVEWATGGIRYLPEPQVTRVRLIPQYVYRPWSIQAEMEQTKILYYPVSDESIYLEPDPYRPPHNLVQQCKALGDEHRMRMVKMLYQKDHTLQELTDKLDLAKSTVHHHLSMLRSAHLVGVVEQRYYLKRTNLVALFPQWQGYLERGGEEIE